MIVPIPPSPPFWINRSYLSHIYIDVAAIVPPIFTGTAFQFKDSANVDWVMNVRPNVYNWSSNSYTPDWIINSDTSVASIAGVPVVDGFYAQVRLDLNKPLSYIWLQPGGLPGTVYKFSLPPAPPDYWRPG